MIRIARALCARASVASEVHETFVLFCGDLLRCVDMLTNGLHDVLSSCMLRVSTLPVKGEESLVTTLLDRERGEMIRFVTEC